MKKFYHRGSLGDIIYSLPAIKASGGGEINLKNLSYKTILYSLLLDQCYIEKVSCLDDDDIEWGDFDYNLDGFRTIHKKDLSKHLVKCHLECLGCESMPKSPWLSVNPSESKPIIINYTKRYHDKEKVDWQQLKPYEDICGFLGTEKEHKFFENKFDMRVEHIETFFGKSCAEIIKGSKIFIGNQSFCYSLAEAMQHPRILEVCHEKPNCMPLSSNGYVDCDIGNILESVL